MNPARENEFTCLNELKEDICEKEARAHLFRSLLKRKKEGKGKWKKKKCTNSENTTMLFANAQDNNR